MKKINSTLNIGLIITALIHGIYFKDYSRASFELLIAYGIIFREEICNKYLDEFKK